MTELSSTVMEWWVVLGWVAAAGLAVFLRARNQARG